jgi:hypothetical protein
LVLSILITSDCRRVPEVRVEDDSRNLHGIVVVFLLVSVLGAVMVLNTVLVLDIVIVLDKVVVLKTTLVLDSPLS